MTDFFMPGCFRAARCWRQHIVIAGTASRGRTHSRLDNEFWRHDLLRRRPMGSSSGEACAGIHVLPASNAAAEASRHG